MFLLIAGLLLWSLVHLFTSVAPQQRQRLRAGLGAQVYRAFYSALILLSLVLIVFGWRNSPPVSLYAPPGWGYLLTPVMMLLALVLLVAANAPGHIRQMLRHPMLTGVVVWALAHLLVNGESRSLFLFGTLAVWAILEMLLINRRDGPRPPVAATWSADIVAVAGGIVLFAALGWLHPVFTGRAALPF
ncbi:MAG: NnrU family protein [Gammaproteobacteria bacterium]|nr:NnrU family protein [Gammaproteobacteria bacterium]NNF60524.1 NnrU protein [Gammaproteobacteria bacterium]NNM20294.1 NnrU protein [Gammaproteobacteria bacterium]